MDEPLRRALARAREAAARARAAVLVARRAGGSAAEATRRRREVDALEEHGRSAVLECLEAGDPALALDACERLAVALDEAAEGAARQAARLRLGAGGAR